MRDDFVDAYKFFIDELGINSQMLMCIEEMSELIKALIKHRRYNTKETEDNVIEEMADVYIMLIQLVIIHGFDGNIVEKKIERLKKRLESEVGNNV